MSGSPTFDTEKKRKQKNRARRIYNSATGLRAGGDNMLQNIAMYGTRLPAEATVVFCSTARLPADNTVAYYSIARTAASREY